MNQLEDLREWLTAKIDGSEETRGEDGLISHFINQIDALEDRVRSLMQPKTLAEWQAAKTPSSEKGTTADKWYGPGIGQTGAGGHVGAMPASPAATPSLLVGQLDSLLKLFREAGWAEDCTLIVGLLNARGWAREAEREIADLCGQLAEWQKKAADVAVAWHGCIHRAEAAEAKLAEATKDAERYRWAKPVLSGDAECDAKTNQLAAGIMAGLDIDVIIDAALATKEST